MGLQKLLQLLFSVMLLIALCYLVFYEGDLKSVFQAVADAFKGLLPTSTIGYGG